MWFGHCFPWCFLFLLASQASPGCDWKMPPDGVPTCEQKINWKAKDEKQATATCLDHFPTTFVKGVTDKKTVTCTVASQFQCNFLKDSVSMFDKCYTFHSTPISMKDYINDNHQNHCKEGSLPVFFTMTQAKHIAMAAHKRNIFNMWVNIKSDGKILEDSQYPGIVKGFLLHQEQWKLHEKHYWKNDELKPTPIVKGSDGNAKYVVPESDKADYMFFRTRNDYWNTLFQGSFERADEDSTASIVCEHQAKIVPEQKWYCDKMKDMTLKAQYCETNKRCVYTSLTSYSLEGSKEAIQHFPGCKEKPSEEYSAGLDDGTANVKYDELTKRGTYRLAAIKMDTQLTNSYSVNAEEYMASTREHCKSTAATDAHRQPFLLYDHFLKEKFGINLKPSWDNNYPKDECSDFPKEKKYYSNTLAVRNGLIVDVPDPVLFPVICSIQTDVDCERTNLCETSATGRICTKRDTWNPETGYYTECACPKFHTLVNGKCVWDGAPGSPVPAYDSCGAIRHVNSHSNWINVKKGWESIVGIHHDKTDRLVVRFGCWLEIYAHPPWVKPNPPITAKFDSGEHEIPNHIAKTLRGWASGMSASGTKCEC